MPRAVALLLLAVVVLSLVLGPLHCLHEHGSVFGGDEGCTLCAHLHTPALLPDVTLGWSWLPQAAGLLAPAIVARHAVAAFSVHAPRGPPRHG